MNIALLNKQIRSIQLEKEKLKELIEELKQSNTLYLSERDLLEDKLKTKTQQLHKFASQCQSNAHKVFMLEQVLAEYKYVMADLQGSNDGLRSLDNIKQAKTVLDRKELDQKQKLAKEINRIVVNLKIDPLFVALKDELTNQVLLKEKLLDQQFE